MGDSGDSADLVRLVRAAEVLGAKIGQIDVAAGKKVKAEGTGDATGAVGSDALDDMATFVKGYHTAMDTNLRLGSVLLQDQQQLASGVAAPDVVAASAAPAAPAAPASMGALPGEAARGLAVWAVEALAHAGGDQGTYEDIVASLSLALEIFGCPDLAQAFVVAGGLDYVVAAINDQQLPPQAKTIAVAALARGADHPFVLAHMCAPWAGDEGPDDDELDAEEARASMEGGVSGPVEGAALEQSAQPCTPLALTLAADD